MPADPATYDEAMSGPDAARWRASMNDEEQSLYDHDVFDWVLPPENVQPLATRFHYMEVQPRKCLCQFARRVAWWCKVFTKLTREQIRLHR